MGIKIVDSLFSKLPKQSLLATDSTSYTMDSLLYHDTSTGTMKEATSSVGTTLNIYGLGTKTFTSGTGSYMSVIPVVAGAVFVVADCTANTAANQLNKDHAMTDARTVNNTSSTVATTLGVFHALALVGSASNKKLYGYFNRVGQVTA